MIKAELENFTLDYDDELFILKYFKVHPRIESSFKFHEDDLSDLIRFMKFIETGKNEPVEEEL